MSLAPVAHTCNPTCSRGRDQRDCSSKPAGANSSQDPISGKKKNHHKTWLVKWFKWYSTYLQGWGPEFKFQYRKKKKKKQTKWIQGSFLFQWNILLFK
jgi:hypothetical protein